MEEVEVEVVEEVEVEGLQRRLINVELVLRLGGFVSNYGVGVKLHPQLCASGGGGALRHCEKKKKEKEIA